MNNKYEELLMEYQLTLSGFNITELELRLKALETYIEQRKLCELMCGGIQNDCDI
jgi:hypothetical protein